MGLTRFDLIVKNGLSLNRVLYINSALREKLSHPSETNVNLDDEQMKTEQGLELALLWHVQV